MSIFKQEKGTALFAPSQNTSDGRADREKTVKSRYFADNRVFWNENINGAHYPFPTPVSDAEKQKNVANSKKIQTLLHSVKKGA